jgi:hypothetical protein
MRLTKPLRAPEVPRRATLPAGSTRSMAAYRARHAPGLRRANGPRTRMNGLPHVRRSLPLCSPGRSVPRRRDAPRRPDYRPERLWRRAAGRTDRSCPIVREAGAVGRGGSLSRTRTCDRSINSRLLYQLSYQGSRFFATAYNKPAPPLQSAAAASVLRRDARLAIKPYPLYRREPLGSWRQRPRGGMVTQRTANPSIPVRFRARPPAQTSSADGGRA